MAAAINGIEPFHAEHARAFACRCDGRGDEAEPAMRVGDQRPRLLFAAGLPAELVEIVEHFRDHAASGREYVA